jgi:TRAP-type C4-dicarboxylate transport system substrate-binding protein
MQVNLNFPGWVNPTANVWEKLDPNARRAFVEALARVIVKAADHRQTDQKKNQNQEERPER